jgi:hypothetical protein
MSAVLGRDNMTHARNATDRSPVDIEAVRAHIEHHRAEANKYEQVLFILVGKTNGNSKAVAAKPTAKPPAKQKFFKPSEEPTIADRVFELLADDKQLHADELVKQLKSVYGVRVRPKNLANILNRWLDKRFLRPAPNTFARKTA